MLRSSFYSSWGHENKVISKEATTTLIGVKHANLTFSLQGELLLNSM